MINILYYLLIAVGINILMFIPAYIYRTDKLTDLSYSITFIIVSIIALLNNPLTLVNIIVASMIITWGLRLGIFLFIRINKTGKDKRFDEIRDSFIKFFRFWFLQGISVWIILIPAIFLITSDATGNPWIQSLGFSIWAFGLIVEAIADIQKFNFNQKEENEDEFIDVGIWKYSRHPNYFGEILCWLGIYIFALTTLTSLQIMLGLISPVYITSLLIFFTGIPKLEEYADEKWGDREDYQEYKRKTNKLILWFRKD